MIETYGAPIWQRFQAHSEGDILGFGVVQQVDEDTDGDGNSIMVCRRSQRYAAQYDHYITAPVTVEAEGHGLCTRIGSILARVDATGGNPALLDIVGPLDDGGVASTNFTLRKKSFGFRVIGIPTQSNYTDAVQSNEIIAVVQAVPALHLVGKTDASHAAGASGTVSVYYGSTAGSETDTTYNVTAWNRFGAISSGKWVRLQWNFQTTTWDIIAAEC